MTFTAEGMQRIICQLRKYHRRDWVLHRRRMHGQRQEYLPAHFLGRLRDELERIRDYERLLRLLRALTNFASLFSVAGD